MKKALITALCAGALVLSGFSVAQTTSNPFKSTVISTQTQDVAQKGKCKKNCKKMKKSSKSGKHHASRSSTRQHQQHQQRRS